MSDPCWIPQIDNIVPQAKKSILSQCDTMEKYKCMLLTVMKSRGRIKKKCVKSCKAENYDVRVRTGTLEPFTKVGGTGRTYHIIMINTQSLINPQDGKNFWSILLKLKLHSFTVFKYKETEFNDFISVVAAVGGSLGLFLGFSCYQLFAKLIRRYLS